MIRKFLYVSLVATSAVTLYSCSTQEDEYQGITVEQVNEGMANSDQEISLSSMTGKSVTRASIESDETYGTFEVANTPGMGIYMLATKDNSNGELPIDYRTKTGGNTGVNIPEGSIKKQYDDVWSVYMDNIQSHATILTEKTTSEGVTISTAPYTEIRWNDGNARYYPMGNYHNYTFFGYYPYTTNTQRYKDSIVVNYTNFDGKTDYLWGIASRDSLDASDPDKEWAYSAKYARGTIDEETNNSKPAQMQFKHIMSRFTFYVSPGGMPQAGTSALNYDKALKTKIKSITICNVPTAFRYVVADNAALTYSHPKNRSGVIECVGLRDMNKVVSLCGTDGNPVTGVQLELNADGTPKENRVGDGIILPPLSYYDYKNNPYRIQMTLVYPDDVTGNDVEAELSVPMGLNLSDGKSMQAGVSYKFRLTIFGLERIGVTATLTPWDEKDAKEVFVTSDDGTIKIQ